MRRTLLPRFAPAARLHRGAALAAVALALVACATRTAPVDTSADVAAIRAAQDHEIAAVTSGNLDTAMSVYAADVEIMPPDEAALEGGDAVRQWLTANFKDYDFSGRYTRSDVDVVGDWGIARYVGTLTLKPKAAGAASVTQAVKGIHIFRRQADGSWKIVRDVWNVDAPASPAPRG